MKWLIASAAVFGTLVGLALVGSIVALLLGLRMIAWAVLLTIHLVRLHFVPTPPPDSDATSSRSPVSP